MTSSVPSVYAWPLIAFMVTVLATRLLWCRTNLYDTYFNNLLAFVLLAQLLRQREMESVLARSGLMTTTTAQQLAFVAMIYASTELIGFTLLWAGLSVPQTQRRHRYYRLAATVCSATYLSAATRARVAGQTLEISGGWDGVLSWSLYLIMIQVLAARFIWMFVSELRKSTYRREFLLAVGGLMLGVATAAGCLEALVFAVTDQLGWTATVNFRLWFHGFEFFGIAVAVFILGGVTLVAKLVSYLGLDSTSRSWNELQNLRTSLQAVVPECSFNVINHNDGPYHKTALQLHQTVIEIRDAMVRLRPYFRCVTAAEQRRFVASNSIPRHERGIAAQAYQLAFAARAKAVGATPGPAVHLPLIDVRSATLREEAHQLLALAKWWPPAHMFTQSHVHEDFIEKANIPR